jgi:shikimate kinase
VIERQENIDALRAGGTVFWLTAPPEVIVSRIEKDTERPPLVEGKSILEEVEEVLARRQDQYAAAAHFTIDTAERNPDEVADAIMAHWALAD